MPYVSHRYVNIGNDRPNLSYAFLEKYWNSLNT